jgi:hypothetical protein
MTLNTIEQKSTDLTLNPSDLNKIQDCDPDGDIDKSLLDKNNKFGHLSESEYNDYVRRRKRKRKQLPEHRTVSPDFTGKRFAREMQIKNVDSKNSTFSC